MSMAKHEIFKESKLELGKIYSRETLARTQGLNSITKTQQGILQFQNCLLLLLTLHESRYHNRFDAHQFRMFFQEESTKTDTVVKRIWVREPVHLLVRRHKLKNESPKAYTYVGPVIATELFGEKPVEISWELCSYPEIKDHDWFKALIQGAS
jgi:hypothetical protein